MTNKLKIITTVTVALFFVSSMGSAEDIVWNNIIETKVNKLDDDQKNQVANALKVIENTRGCQSTLAACLAKGDLTAKRHAGYIVRMVRKGKDLAFIKTGIKKRHESAFPEEKFKIDIKNHPYMGKKNAKVVITEFACFQCPLCSHLAPKLKKLHKKFGTKIVRYFKYYPVRSHKRGVPTAIAGIAAFKQGKFWKMHDKMFANRTDLNDDDLLEYATEIGLDIKKFKSDVADKSALKTIEKDKLEGMRTGIEGTPAFFINGKMFLGMSELPEFIDRIEEELDIIEGRIK